MGRAARRRQERQEVTPTGGPPAPPAPGGSRVPQPWEIVSLPAGVTRQLLVALGGMLVGDDNTVIRLKEQAFGTLRGAAIALDVADDTGNFSFNLPAGQLWPIEAQPKPEGWDAGAATEDGP